MFITEAIAATEAAAPAEASPLAGFLIQLILVFAIFYFLLIRPQQKKMKEHEDMLNAIKPKDEVITGGGIYGRVVKGDEDTLTIEIAEGVEVKVSRATVREVVSPKENSK
jgi:preprotein translocase subunit YajC